VKRIHRVMAIVMFALVALSLPSIGYTASPVVVRFWNGIGPPEAEVLSEFVKEFNEKHAGQYRVEETMMKWDTLYSKLLIDFRTGNQPDLLTFHQPALKQYSTLGVLQDLDDLVAELGIDGQEYVSTAWDGTVIDGKRYAVPMDMHPWALYYNRDLFREAGLPDRGPVDMKEFMEFAQKLTKDIDGDGKPDQWGFSYEYNGAVPHRFLISLLGQKGKSLLSDDNQQAVFDTDDTREALQFMYDLVYKYKVTPERETDPQGAFRRGVVGMILDGPWSIAEFRDTEGLDYMTSPMPIFYDQAGTWGSSHTLVIPKNTKPAVQEAAVQFIGFVVKEKGYNWAQKAGHLPIRKDILGSAEFKELKESQAFADSLEHMIYYPPIVEYSRVFSHDPSSPLVKMTESVLLGKTDIATAMTLAQEEFNVILEAK
jgi:multiple sugar transport system substrate-binding protein